MIVIKAQKIESWKFTVAGTYLYTRWLCFLIPFFGKKDLTYFYDFWHPY